MSIRKQRIILSESGPTYVDPPMVEPPISKPQKTTIKRRKSTKKLQTKGGPIKGNISPPLDPPIEDPRPRRTYTRNNSKSRAKPIAELKRTPRYEQPRTRIIKPKIIRRKVTLEGDDDLDDTLPTESPLLRRTKPPQLGTSLQTKPKSKWMLHLAKYRQQHPELSYKECMQAAKTTYSP